MSKGFSIAIGLLLFWQAALSQTNTWTGAVDTDWHKDCNWSLNLIPICAHDVIIPFAVNLPIITGIAHCGSLDIQTLSGGHLEIVVTGGGVLYDASLNAGICTGTPTDNSGAGCCTPWGQTSAGIAAQAQAYGVATDASAVYAVGFDRTASSGGNNQWRIEKRDLATGAHLAGSPVLYNHTANSDIANRVASDGSFIYVAGIANGSTTSTNWRMEKRAVGTIGTIAASGESTPPGTTNIGVHDAVIDATDMYIAGFETVSTNNTRWRIEKRSLANCALGATWTRDFTTNTARPDIAYGIAVDATSIYVVGGSDGPTPANNDGIWRMVKINKGTGIDQWSITNNPTVFSTPGGGGGSSEPALDVAVDGTGVYVVGFSIGNPTNYELIVQKRDITTGALLWSIALPTTGVVIGGSYANLAIDATGLYVSSLQAGLWKVDKLDLSNGNTICSGLATGGVRAGDISVINGNIYVAGSTPNQFRTEKMCCTH